MFPDFTYVTKQDMIPEALAAVSDDPQIFQITREEKKRKKRRSPQKFSREVLHNRITRFLDGFRVDVEDSSDDDDEIIPALVDPEVTAIETNV